MTFTETVEFVGKFVNALGVAAIVLGCGVAAALTLRDRGLETDRYRLFRRRLGRAILLGLELLVAADIIRTVAANRRSPAQGSLRSSSQSEPS